MNYGAYLHWRARCWALATNRKQLHCSYIKQFPNLAPPDRIVCKTGPSLVGPQAATVFVGNRAGVTSALDKFHYKVSAFGVCVCSEL